MNNDTLRTLYLLTYKTNLDKRGVYEAAKEYVDAYEHEGHEKRHEAQEKPPKRAWSPEKRKAYGKLLDCTIGRMSPETICDAAKELAQACETKKPKAGETYRDSSGKRFVIAEVVTMDFGNRTFVKFYEKEAEQTLWLEEFNATFKLEQ